MGVQEIGAMACRETVLSSCLSWVSVVLGRQRSRIKECFDLELDEL